MVNLRWDIYNMLTIWLMVGLLYVGIGLARSLVVKGGDMGDAG